MQGSFLEHRRISPLAPNSEHQTDFNLSLRSVLGLGIFLRRVRSVRGPRPRSLDHRCFYYGKEIGRTIELYFSMADCQKGLSGFDQHSNW